MLSREPSGDRIVRSCRHTAPDLTVMTEVKERIAKSLLSQYVLGFWGPFKPGIKQKQAQESDRMAKHILRQCRSLSQRSCDKCQLDFMQISLSNAPFLKFQRQGTLSEATFLPVEFSGFPMATVLQLVSKESRLKPKSAKS